MVRIDDTQMWKRNPGKEDCHSIGCTAKRRGPWARLCAPCRRRYVYYGHTVKGKTLARVGHAYVARWWICRPTIRMRADVRAMAPAAVAGWHTQRSQLARSKAGRWWIDRVEGELDRSRPARLMTAAVAAALFLVDPDRDVYQYPGGWRMAEALTPYLALHMLDLKPTYPTYTLKPFAWRCMPARRVYAEHKPYLHQLQAEYLDWRMHNVVPQKVLDKQQAFIEKRLSPYRVL